MKLQPSHDEHLTNKNIARDNKTVDKERVANDPELCVAVFDLEKVLTTPQSEASNFYYKRKFAVYNFTVYDIVNKVGYCYMWDESEAKRFQRNWNLLVKIFKNDEEEGFQRVLLLLRQLWGPESQSFYLCNVGVRGLYT